ncbi:MAG TPA: hypothetical protein VD860_16755 [Azospirillum sp.]|nr:hypothetical protein [Azospirillum sp.]
MTLLKAAAIGLGLLALSGCAVYDPYPVYPSYPAYPPSVVVQPRVYGYWGGGWSDGPRHHHHRRHWGHRGHGHGHWR